jgi:hypothetical protein
MLPDFSPYIMKVTTILTELMKLLCFHSRMPDWRKRDQMLQKGHKA